MADTVDSSVVFTGSRYYAIRLTNRSDGTGESAVIKIDKSTLAGPLGREPSQLVIMEATWNIQGFSSVQINWDANTDDEGLIMANIGYKDFSAYGGLRDPKSTGTTGDLVLTTYGAAANATYDIFLVVRLKG